MARTRISSKGQVVLPKEVRDSQGWTAGTELEVEAQGNVVVLKPARPFPPTTIEEVRGCAGYKGPPRTLEEMDAGVRRGIRKMWREFEKQSKR
jgi:AbrB family looped-hinge helix DNA binding protein